MKLTDQDHLRIVESVAVARNLARWRAPGGGVREATVAALAAADELAWVLSETGDRTDAAYLDRALTHLERAVGAVTVELIDRRHRVPRETSEGK